MGVLFSTLSRMWGFQQQIRIVMVGLDAASKTTILYKLKLGATLPTFPSTVGFNVETVEYKNISFTVWDVGSQTKIRRLWHHYYKDTQGMIFVVDSADRERMDEAKDELHAMMSDGDMPRDAVLLVFANKRDLPAAMTAAEITDALELRSVRHHEWHIQPACAITAEGLYEGFTWLSDVICRPARQDHRTSTVTPAACCSSAPSECAPTQHP
ncbi:hypothetical protein FOA52_010681 [Chlamydomonas sp. UWO 241]|nr:hypothetical protein FOA52_010681 [Chlamydomonas sp. UWO 241]